MRIAGDPTKTAALICSKDEISLREVTANSVNSAGKISARAGACALTQPDRTDQADRPVRTVAQLRSTLEQHEICDLHENVDGQSCNETRAHSGEDIPRERSTEINTTTVIRDVTKADNNAAHWDTYRHGVA